MDVALFLLPEEVAAILAVPDLALVFSVVQLFSHFASNERRSFPVKALSLAMRLRRRIGPFP